MEYSQDDIIKFWNSVNVRGRDECWPWTKGRQSAGYGVLCIGQKGLKRPALAHRMSCTIAHGSPAGIGINALHSCDNPPCCNPNHLRWGTQKDNTADCIKRGRASKPPANAAYRRRDTQPKGADVWNQTLTEAKVRQIWKMQLAGGMTVKAISEAVDAKHHAVADVCRGRSWRHLPNAPSVQSLKEGGVRRGYNQFNTSS